MSNKLYVACNQAHLLAANLNNKKCDLIDKLILLLL